MAEVPEKDDDFADMGGDYEVPEEVDMKELSEKDKDDESLRKWKESLGLTEDIVQKDKEPGEVVVKEMKVVFEESDKEPLLFSLEGEENLQKLANEPFLMKEKSKYHIELNFEVKKDMVFGLRYLHVVYKSGLKVDKENQMIGSYAPKDEMYTARFPTQECPSGFIARGKYSAKAKFIDDYKKEFLAWKYTFKITK